MKQKELLWQEKHLIMNEFNNAFFEKILENSQEWNEAVKKIAKQINASKDFDEQKVWKSIFHKAIETVVPNGICQALELSQDRVIEKKYFELYNLLYGFYADPDFLCLDMAQEIQYNLYRLEEPIEIDLNDYEEECKEWIEIGRKKYGEEKEFFTDFEQDMQRLKEKYKECPKRSVAMFCEVEDCKICVDANFLDLNLAYMGNEKFQDYLFHFEKRPRADWKNLMDLIKKLDRIGVSMHYIWEKMTNFNAVCIVAKFFLHTVKNCYGEDITAKKQQEYVQNMSEKNRCLFRRILEMPNYLTRLLILKQILSYIERQNPLVIQDLLEKFTVYLAEINNRYENIREKVLLLSILVKWELDTDNNRKIDRWHESLDKEYPLSLYEKLYVSTDIPCDLFMTNQNLNDIDLSQFKEKEYYGLILRGIQIKRRLGEYKDFQVILELWRKLSYMKFIEEEPRMNETFAKKLVEAGFVPLDKEMLANMSRENEIEYEETPQGEIYKAENCVEGQIQNDGIKENIKFEIKDGLNGRTFESQNQCGDEIEKRVKTMVQPYLLSQYQYLLFENTMEFEEDTKIIGIVNCLFYHFYL